MDALLALDPIILATLMGILIVVAAASFTLGDRAYRKSTPPAPVLPSDLYEELADLRHLKEQFDNPPQRHEHVWPRKPDKHKMGWMRFHCAYKDCPAIEWRPG